MLPTGPKHGDQDDGTLQSWSGLDDPLSILIYLGGAAVLVAVYVALLASPLLMYGRHKELSFLEIGAYVAWVIGTGAVLYLIAGWAEPIVKRILSSNSKNTRIRFRCERCQSTFAALVY